MVRKEVHLNIRTRYYGNRTFILIDWSAVSVTSGEGGILWYNREGKARRPTKPLPLRLWTFGDIPSYSTKPCLSSHKLREMHVFRL